MRRCARITRAIRQLGVEESALPTYEGFPNLASFLEEFEENVTESQQLSSLDCVLKDTLTRWLGTHKQPISDWPQCRRLMEIIFGDEINYDDKKYT